MTIEEKLSAIENNLNAYGQWDVTQTEWNAMKVAQYSEGVISGIEVGRKNAIDECIKTIEEEFAECGYVAESLKMRLKEQVDDQTESNP